MRYFILFLVMSLAACAPSIEKDFKQIPTELNDTENLIKQISPLNKYVYWECVFKDYLQKSSRIIVNFGDSSSIKNLKYQVPTTGFINKNWTGYYYIAYHDGNQLNYVYDIKSLQKFISNFNDLAEALLIAEAQDFSVDLHRKIGSAYRKTKNGFELHISKFHRCPVQTEAFKVDVDSLGNISTKSLNYFYDVHKNTCTD